MSKLPLYEMKVGDPTEDDVAVDFVALVDDPAIQKGWMAFSDTKRFDFQVTNEERRIITGALMIADLPIYRRDDERGEYNVVFRKPEIEKIVKKFAKSGYFNNVNLMHNDSMRPSGVYMFESIFVDKDRGVSAPSIFEGITDGSWVASYYVLNDEVWAQIKDGTFTGFSVQGFFDMAMKKTTQVSDFELALKNLAKAFTV